MKKVSQAELENILELHQKWLNNEDGGVRADLSHTNLRYADLSGTNLSSADLQGSDLHNTDLSYSDLNLADLRDADLRDADLCYALLRYADLRGSDLHRTDLRYAILLDTDLSGANLSSANLRGTDLRFTNLRGANLCGANLRWVAWHDALGIETYEVGLRSSRENARLTYIPSIDIATTGCFQDTWENLKDRVRKVYKKDNPKIYKKYQVAINSIENQMKLDKEIKEDENSKVAEGNLRELEARLNTLSIKLANLAESLEDIKE